jgi:hypothetical protein
MPFSVMKAFGVVDGISSVGNTIEIRDQIIVGFCPYLSRIKVDLTKSIPLAF